MVVQCPRCETGRLLGQEELSDVPHVVVQCSKCQGSFVVRASDLVANETSTVVGVQTKLPAEKRVSLVVIKGLAKGKNFRLAKPEVSIGRVGADVIIEDPEVSSRHCALEVRGTSGVVTDLGSRNGTFVDETRINRCQLEHLGEFRIGGTTIMFTVTDELE